MRLTKDYSPILGCEVWTLEQSFITAEGETQVAQSRTAVPNVELTDYGRSFIAARILTARAAIRQYIAEETA